MINIFWILLGLLAAFLFLTFTQTQPEQQPKILAIGLIITAFIYVVFAIIGRADHSWLLIEFSGVGIYSLLAILGIRYSNWWLMLGWIAHPLWDIKLHLLNEVAAFTPNWYAIMCVSFDLLIAAYIVNMQLKIFNFNKSEYEDLS